MPGRSLDAIIMETLGIKEMVIARLQWQIEDLKAQVEALQQGEAPQKEQEPT